MDLRKFTVFFKVNISDEYPGEKIEEVSTSDYIKIKHGNIEFSLNFLMDYFQKENLYQKHDLEKLWISIDDVEYFIIFDKESPLSSSNSINQDGVLSNQLAGSALVIPAKNNDQSNLKKLSLDSCSKNNNKDINVAGNNESKASSSKEKYVQSPTCSTVQ